MKKIVLVGHIDSGKSTLLCALRSNYVKNIDTHYEEGDPVTITNDWDEYFFFDYADDDEYREKLTGDVDGAILVVSCTDGPLSGTELALELCKEMGIDLLAVFMPKFDWVDDEELAELMEMDICDLVDEYGFDSSNLFITKGSPYHAYGYGGEKYAKPIKDLFDAVVDKL